MNNGSDNSTHRKIQERLLDRIVLILGIIAIPTLFFSILRYVDMGQWFNAYYINIALTIFVLSLAIFRKKIYYTVKAAGIISAFMILAVSGAWYTGLSSFYIPFLLLSILIGIIFLGKNRGILIYAAGAMLIIVSGIFNVTGLIAPVTDLNFYHTLPTSWLNVLCNYSIITGLVVLTVGKIGYMLSEKIAEFERSNRELKNALAEIKTLQGILPICARCKKIRDSDGYWTQVESYIEKYSELKFTHGICEKCSEEMYRSEVWYKNKK